MILTGTRVAVASAFAFLVALGGVGTAAAEDAAVVVSKPHPVRMFALAGVGLPELAHLELGTFLGSRVSVEATVAWAGVYGPRYGAGVFYTFGSAQGPRPPRHGLLVGARLMLDSGATFNSQGDDLSSYGAIPVGYSFLSDRGFFFRATVCAVVVREETRRDGPTPLMPIVEHGWAVGGPLFTASFGFAWDGT
jgi:hypothetical protein